MSAALAFVAAALGVLGLGELMPPRGLRRFGALRAFAALGSGVRRLSGVGVPLSLEVRVLAAGVAARPREVLAAKLAGAVLSGCFGLLLAAGAPGRLGLLLVVVLPAAGFFAPDWWLRRRAQQRARAARRELPALLDLLRVTVEAGLAPAAAFGAVGERAGGVLAAEWRTVGHEATLGVPLAESLRELERRLPLPEVAALVAALDRSVRHGAPLAETLAAQARDARLSRKREIEEEAARAGPKIQLVVALLLVPSVLLLVAAALASALLEGGGFALTS
jgi:tight adherence protein C